jgi:tRNA threonylcarbamoyladenosine biosynthesis protein TsaE
LGEEWGIAAKAPWIIGLTGELGAGKTQLVKGIARGLRITTRVHSPTFTLVNEYRGGRLPLFHLDLYRLETAEQIIRAGLEEYFYRPSGIAVIEWAERWPELGHGSISGPYRPDYLRVRIESLSENEREICYEDFGH